MTFVCPYHVNSKATPLNCYGSIISPRTSVNLVRPTHRISRNQYCFPMSVAPLGGPNWNVWGSLLNDLCRQGSQSDCKHMERFLRQEKHLYNAERGNRQRSGGRRENRKSQQMKCTAYVMPLMLIRLDSGRIFHEILTAFQLNGRVR